MFACPHCGAKVIPMWRKVNATSVMPTGCRMCGGLSFVSGWAHFGTMLLFELLLWGSIVAAIFLKTWVTLLAFPIGLTAISVGESLVFPLIPTKPGAVRRARRNVAIQLTAGAALIATLSLLLG
jgi:hypothetical protein